MVEKKYVEKTIVDTKRYIDIELNKRNYNNALSLIAICADVLYNTNLYYMDVMLERSLENISKEMKINLYNKYEKNENILLFFDGFGLNDRGLIQIYLTALCKFKKVVYVTYEDRKSSIPDVRKILNEHNCIEKYINREKTNYTEQIEQLNDVVKGHKPANMFFYSTPNDVVATTLMYAYAGIIKRYQINLTDHAFWLGAGCVDICIEFRNYGRRISTEYRNIDSSKIRIIPFYPIVHKERPFLGFPFEVNEDQQVVFSGGALYKTFDSERTYYKIVDRLLSENSNVIFWYAGSGDTSEIAKIIEKYPQRAYFTAERSDLFQVLQNCSMYLSTYPISGGLMFQYAALAGKVPVTLFNGEITDDFLLNQSNIGIMYSNVDEVLKEINHLIHNIEYADERGKVMRQSVISPDVFDQMVYKLFDFSVDNVTSECTHIETQKFRDLYLEKITKADVDRMFLRRNSLRLGLKFFPSKFLRVGVHLFIRLCLNSFIAIRKIL